MTIIRRDIVSVPRRTPSETWAAICELVSKAGSDARVELMAAGDVATTLIAEEATGSTRPSSRGPSQVRVYTLHHNDSLEADLDDEQALVTFVADDDWVASLPADESDVGWASTALNRVTKRVTVRRAGA